ncbi:MAG: hypothetical protein ACI8PZ_003721 [Myxococcota bacterium]|jgi:hypothetical protein
MIAWMVTAALAGEGAFDHATFGAFLDGAVADNGVSYSTLAARRATLDTYLAELAALSLDGLSTPDQVALWVNAYNANTLATVLDAGPPASIRDIDGGEVWKTRSFTVAGQTVTLDDMEHRRARPLTDGRIHAVVNCASKGCPPLPPEPIRGAALSAQLDAASRRWAKINAYSWQGDTLQLSKIFDWYAEDFVSGRVDGVSDPKIAGAVGFLVRFVDAEEAARIRAAAGTAGWQDYDWTLNAR